MFLSHNSQVLYYEHSRDQKLCSELSLERLHNKRTQLIQTLCKLLIGTIGLVIIKKFQIKQTEYCLQKADLTVLIKNIQTVNIE